jgi:hypothetical protein
MLPYRDSRFTVWTLAVFFALALCYAFFEARGILFGPTITLAAPISEVHEPFVSIKGTAERISSLSMNGKQVPVTKDGAFAVSYLLAAGYNRIVLDAKDQYGRSKERVIEIMYTPSASSTPATDGSSQASSQPSQDATAGTAGQAPNTEATSTVSGSSTAPVAQ